MGPCTIIIIIFGGLNIRYPYIYNIDKYLPASDYKCILTSVEWQRYHLSVGNDQKSLVFELYVPHGGGGSGTAELVKLFDDHRTHFFVSVRAGRVYCFQHFSAIYRSDKRLEYIPGRQHWYVYRAHFFIYYIII